MVVASNTERAVSLVEKYSNDSVDSETNNSSSQMKRRIISMNLVQEEQQNSLSNGNGKHLIPAHHYDDIDSNDSMSSPAESYDLS